MVLDTKFIFISAKKSLWMRFIATDIKWIPTDLQGSTCKFLPQFLSHPYLQHSANQVQSDAFQTNYNGFTPALGNMLT